MLNDVGSVGVNCLKWRNYHATKIQTSYRHFLKCDRDSEDKSKIRIFRPYVNVAELQGICRKTEHIPIKSVGVAVRAPLCPTNANVDVVSVS